MRQSPGDRQDNKLSCLGIALCPVSAYCQSTMGTTVYDAWAMAQDPNVKDTHITELRRSFGTRVKELRKRKKWTQKELSTKLGITFSVLNKYECGYNVPPIDKLIQLADALNTSIDYLMTGSQSEGSPIHNNLLIERVRSIQDFSPDEQETVLGLLDALILKHQVEGQVDRFKK